MDVLVFHSRLDEEQVLENTPFQAVVEIVSTNEVVLFASDSEDQLESLPLGVGVPLLVLQDGNHGGDPGSGGNHQNVPR